MPDIAAQRNPFHHLWRLGYHRLVPIVPPGAELSKNSSLSRRIRVQADGTLKGDPRGKAPGVLNGDGSWHSYDFVRHESEEADLDRWNAMGAGVGIKTGRGLVAVDVDVTDQAAAEAVQALAQQHLGPLVPRIGKAPKTLLLYRVSGAEPVAYERVSFSTQTEDKAIVELLSEGRQFVAAGIHPATGKPYRWPNGVPTLGEIPEVTPEALSRFMGAVQDAFPQAVRSGSTSADRASINQEALAAASPGEVARLVSAIPNAGGFEDRDAYIDMGYAIKASLPDDPDRALRIFQEWCARWEGGTNDPETVAEDFARMKPPFAIGVQYLRDMALRHGGQRGQSAAAESWFQPEIEAHNDAGAPRQDLPKTFSFTDFDEAADQALTHANKPLIKGLLDQGAMSVLYGASGAGKTFVAMDLAYHVATGRDYGGNRVTQGDVVYVAAEGAVGVRKRAAALRIKYGGVPDDLPKAFSLLLASVDLFDQEAELSGLIAAINAKAAATGRSVGLVVIDTLARSMGAGDENSTADMNVLVRHVGRLQAETGAHVMLVHHTGKDASRGARGSSALRAATDTELEVTTEPGRRIQATKQRDVDGEWWSGFDLEGVILGDDADGEPISSCTVALQGRTGVTVGAPSPKEREYLDAVGMLCQVSQEPGKGVSATEVALYLGEKPNNARAFLSRLQVKRLLEKTAAKGWILSTCISERAQATYDKLSEEKRNKSVFD